MTTGPEHLKIVFMPVQNLAAELAEFRAAVVHGRHVHGAQHTVGNVGRPGYLKEVASAPGACSVSVPARSRSRAICN